MATSQQYIERLHKRGYSDTLLGKLLGRDSSLLSQVRRGLKPGANLTDALSDLAKSRRKPPAPGKPVPALDVPRRLSKSGSPAKVRTAPHEIMPGQANRIQINTEAGRQSQVNQLRKAPPDARVFLTATVKRIRYKPDFTSDATPLGDGTLRNKEVDLFADGGNKRRHDGIKAETLLQLIDDAGGNGAAFNTAILKHLASLSYIELAEGIGKVEMQIKT